jgi:hypothetical protein
LERQAAAGGVHLFDQGFFQALWSVTFRAAQPYLDATVIASLLARRVAGSRVTVVVVETPCRLLEERLATRTTGASRLERELRAGGWASHLERAAAALHRVEALLAAAEQTGTIRVLRVDASDPVLLALRAETVCEELGLSLPSEQPTPT